MCCRESAASSLREAPGSPGGRLAAQQPVEQRRLGSLSGAQRVRLGAQPAQHRLSLLQHCKQRLCLLPPPD
jgi:hypothetical protein